MLIRVSPKSRGPRPQKASRRQSGGPNRVHPSGRSRLREPGFRDACDTLIKSMEVLADPSEVPDAYEAEALVSVLLGDAGKDHLSYPERTGGDSPASASLRGGWAVPGPPRFSTADRDVSRCMP